MIQLVSALAPLLVGSFFIMLSLLNQNVKGIVYLAGAVLATVLNIFVMNQIGSPVAPDASMLCNLVELPYLTKFNSPSPSALFIAFTFAYVFLPMRYNNQMNYPVIITLLCLLALDSISKIKGKCTTAGGSVLGSLLGFVFGALWYSLFHGMGYDSLLYFDEMDSNNVVCSKPSKQTFKCSVYKNGELVSSNIA
jgi:hypothetical protein